jgi:tRNA A-37 threonylcarbamoyl transferase component Bud32
VCLEIVNDGLVELKPHPWITTNAFFLSADRSKIIKYHRPKKRRLNFYRFRALALIGYPIPYEFRSESARCKHECEVYAHWLSRGYSVPKLLDDSALVLPGPKDKCIVLEYVDGVDLAALLLDPSVKLSRKLDLVRKLFFETNRRHLDVFANADRNLIKYDANLRNIMVRDDELIHVDFECGRIAETLTRGAARELSRYVVDSINSLEVRDPEDVVATLLAEYKIARVIDYLTAGKRKRESGAGKFTNADLAQVLAARSKGANNES